MAVFPSIKIEGGLLGPDLLDQVVGADVPGQKPADFGLDGKRNLTDEIAATFADARALWGVFQNRLERLPEGDVATTVTRDSWMIPFLGLLGFAPTFNQRAYEIDGLSFAISHRADEAEKAPPVHIVGYRQELGRVPVSGRPRLAPHSLVQEFLNRTENLWGLVSNGRILRLLRDCSYIRRQAYIEFDLQAMLEEQRFQDFAALYRLLHRTRLPRTDENAAECLLEKYYAHSIEQGGRVRDHLRDGVEQCILRLANGFLRYPASDDLRRRAAPDCADNDRITPEDFYRQLLRLVYRFLFLLVSEDRGLLSTDPLYREHYGVARLRRLLDNRASFTDHDDLWQSLRVLWYLLNNDTRQPLFSDQPMAAALGLPVLNGELFAGQPLDSASISNYDLLDGFFYLAKYEAARGASWQRVNYSALDVEELGSVYESLLEFHPAVQRDAAGRLTFDLVFGSERKTTGSYYTPPELVGELIKSALEPVLADRLKASPKDPEKAILSIRVCDPACGSGHFLLAAARRLGKELARVRSGEDEPAPERVREAIRDVVSHCIYGVDKNPLAVDLCRVALWLESNTSSKPLTFLDHRIRCGDSLIGVHDLAVLSDGIPDEAYRPLEGDDKAVARSLASQNREERAGQLGLFTWDPQGALNEITRQSRQVDAIADDSPEAIRRKRELFQRSHADAAWLQRRDACDLWCAAFFQEKKRDVPAVTTVAVRGRLAGRPTDAQVCAAAQVLAARHRFFHWPLEFPEVFADGGFDVVLGNPPFVNAIEGRISDSVKRYLRATHSRVGGTADLAYLFLDKSTALIQQRGRIGIIQPRAVLNAAPAAGIRRSLTGPTRVNMIYAPDRSDFFTGAAVFVCLVALGPDIECRVSRSRDPVSAEWTRAPIQGDNWWLALNQLLDGCPVSDARKGPSLGDVFEVSASMTTADAYDVLPFVTDSENGPGKKLITTGLIDPRECHWGTTRCRYLKKDFRCPRVRITDGLSPSLRKRLEKASRPKILVAGLSKRVECFLDERGECVGAVSTYSIFDPNDNVDVLRQLCYYLLTDEVSEQFRAELGGNAMGGGNTTMKRDFLQRLLLPEDMPSSR